MPNKAVFLDRDGTIIAEKEYLSDPAKVELLPGAGDGVAHIRAAGYLAVMTSNQSGVARGYFDEAAVARVNDRLQDMLGKFNTKLDGTYYCPHYAKGSNPVFSRECDCRKPKPGMLKQAARELDIDLNSSWVIGDKQADIDFGRQAGLKTILVLTGYGEETRKQGMAPGEGPDYIARDLGEAAELIIALKKTARGLRNDGE
ncbi:HAD family hydrolase [bacterium]|nr:HAD family hydrolase [bacterium]